MKSLFYFVSILTLFASSLTGAKDVSEAAAKADEKDALPLAKPCDPEGCQLPNCRCSTTDIPGGLQAKDVPQFVLVTFDDNVNVINMNNYRELLYNRHNKNSCPASATFYVSHEYTDYTLVNELYNQGFEIAVHSISHKPSQPYWQKADYGNMRMEFGDQKALMSHFANIPYDSIKGIRIPFLQMTGNASFEVMSDYGIQYDSSWPTGNKHVDPGLWPYTLDYASTQECIVPPCPNASIPGVWVQPMVSWKDLDGVLCSMVDNCYNVPDHSDEDAWFRFILRNFQRHYYGNRSPFGFYIHEWYISESTHPAVRRAFMRFMDLINIMEDVFMVNSAEVIEWVKNPVPINKYRQKPCKTFTPTTCAAKGCGPLTSVHNKWSSYYMQVCSACPSVYPWLANPLGQ